MFKKMKTFILILIIGILCSAIPFGTIGMVFGSLAVLVNTLIISLIYKKELYG